MRLIVLIAVGLPVMAWEAALPGPAAAQAEPPICVAARSARARNSPAAPGLERQCDAAIQASRPAAPIPLGRKQKPLDSAAGLPPVPLGRVHRTDNAPEPSPDPLEIERSMPAAPDDFRRSDGPAPRPPPLINDDDHFDVPGSIGRATYVEPPRPTPICQVDGLWWFRQTDGTQVNVDIKQEGKAFSGSARFRGTAGTVENGWTFGRRVEFRVRWADGTVGDYGGTIDSDGLLEGGGQDITKAYSVTHWEANRIFRC